MSKILLDMETLESVPERQHKIDHDEAEALKVYFKEQEGEEIPDIEGLTCEEAANKIGPTDFEEETLQHIIGHLFSDKYDPIY